MEFSTVLTNISSLVTTFTSMITSLSDVWIVWLGVMLTVFSFLFGKLLTLFRIRRGRRGRG